jgi:hypothetical protein
MTHQETSYTNLHLPIKMSHHMKTTITDNELDNVTHAAIEALSSVGVNLSENLMEQLNDELSSFLFEHCAVRTVTDPATKEINAHDQLTTIFSSKELFQLIADANGEKDWTINAIANEVLSVLAIDINNIAEGEHAERLLGYFNQPINFDFRCYETQDDYNASPGRSDIVNGGSTLEESIAIIDNNCLFKTYEIITLQANCDDWQDTVSRGAEWAEFKRDKVGELLTFKGKRCPKNAAEVINLYLESIAGTGAHFALYEPDNLIIDTVFYIALEATAKILGIDGLGAEYRIQLIGGYVNCRARYTDESGEDVDQKLSYDDTQLILEAYKDHIRPILALCAGLNIDEPAIDLSEIYEME